MKRSSRLFHTNDPLEQRLMSLAAVFVLLYAVILTLSPAVRLHTFLTPLRLTHWIGVVIWLIGFRILVRQVNHQLIDHDPYLLPIAALMTGWGLLTIWRLDEYYGMRQTVWLGISLLAMWGGLRVPGLVNQIRRYKYVWLVGGLALTALTFIFGTYPGGDGPRLWLGCCGVYLQPSEPLKLLLIVYLAAYLADNMPLGFKLIQLLTPTLVLLGVGLSVLIFQRDLGTASLIVLLYMAIIFIATGKRRVLVAAVVLLAVAGTAAFFFFDVIQVRIAAWLNPWLDASGRSYQIVQSLIAMAEGGLFGAGPGLGSPSVVPVAQSDFVFAAIVEEMGLIGAFGLFALLGLLLVRGLRAALLATNSYQRYLAAGTTLFIFMQSMLIIGGNIRLLPLTGVTLPFISYGGSSLLTSCLAMLLLVIVSSRLEEEPATLPRPQAYNILTTIGLFTLTALACLSLWWGYLHADELIYRTDNPRRYITDRYVPRGKLLDRSNQTLSETIGEAGNYSRTTRYPALSTTLGYNDFLYGQGGLEAALDPYLRGVQGNAASLIWTTDLLFNQPPKGLDVRLSIDSKLQKTADNLMNSSQVTGALVMLNADTGEILAIVSHPYFNPETLGQDWEQLKGDPTAPLLNRVTQGLYPLGSAITPFALSVVLDSQPLPGLPDTLSIKVDNQVNNCLLSPGLEPTWSEALQFGCPAADLRILNLLIPSQMSQVINRAGFDNSPVFVLDVAEPILPSIVPSPQDFVNGRQSIQVSPLQVALAAAALTNEGNRPAPRIAMAVNTPHQGWVILPAENSTSAFPVNGSQETVKLLASGDFPGWQSLAVVPTQHSEATTGEVTWYMAGTLPDWQGIPLVVVVLLEENDPYTAKLIGSTLLMAAQAPK